MVRLHETLSDDSVYHRYLMPLQLTQRVAHERLARICFIDYDREIAMVIEHQDPRTRALEIWGVGRLTKTRSRDTAAFAILIGDPYQGRGLGSEVLKRMVDIARAEKLQTLVGRVAADNQRMRGLCREMGFRFCEVEGNIVQATLSL
jgi:acetyltransferase